MENWENHLVRHKETGELLPFEFNAAWIFTHDDRFAFLVEHYYSSITPEDLAINAQMMLQRYYRLDMERLDLLLCIKASVEQRERGIKPAKALDSEETDT